MRYIIWICLLVTLIAAWMAPDPIWWMILALGCGANGLVCAANDWKMPVLSSRCAESARHTPMTKYTRYKPLGDVIPTGLGKASIGDFLITVGMMGVWITRTKYTTAFIVVLGAYWLWIFGWSRGFRLTEKWPKDERDGAKKNVPIVLAVLLIGNLFGFHGCSVHEMNASVTHLADVLDDLPSVHKPVVAQKENHSLGKMILPPSELLKRLTERTAKEEKLQSEVTNAIEKAMGATSQTVTFIQPNGQKVTVAMMMSAPVTPKSARSGPFCRVTCAAHHGGEYDVETLPQACKANWIPPTAQYVPGWEALSKTEEIANPWPGPAQAGFEKYKLYWSPIQSEAKVVHKSESLAGPKT